MSDFTLGQRVAFSRPLSRRSRTEQRRHLRYWEPNVWDNTQRIGIVVGERTLANGDVTYGSYDEPTTFRATGYIKALLIATDLRRKPVLVAPENVVVNVGPPSGPSAL